MKTFVDYPAVMFVTLLVIFIGAVALGAYVLKRFVTLPDAEREDFNLVQTSTLTLLALLIGFSLSMAVNRYDQRKTLEEQEANAIGTEYARADLLDQRFGGPMKAALVRYAQLRLADYQTRDRDQLAHLTEQTASLQADLWNLASAAAKDRPTPISAVVATGMNDVLNSQDYAEAARINHIPVGAWILMFVIAVFACVVQGYGAKGNPRRGLLIIILPVTVSLSLALIADIDSPRGGIIRIQPQNLARLLHSLGK